MVSRFSSPLGDGLVRYVAFANDSSGKFSSPSGDGLVHDIAVLVDDNAEVFVPEWGWVGSYYCFETNYPLKIFSSPLGDGLVLQR